MPSRVKATSNRVKTSFSGKIKNRGPKPADHCNLFKPKALSEGDTSPTPANAAAPHRLEKGSGSNLNSAWLAIS